MLIVGVLCLIAAAVALVIGLRHLLAPTGDAAAVQRALAPTELAAAVMLLAGGITAVTRVPSAGLVLGICVAGAFVTLGAGAWRVVRVAAAEQAIADRASAGKEDSCAGSCGGCDKLCG